MYYVKKYVDEYPEMKITGVEFNKRCHEVFDSHEEDVYYYIELQDGIYYIPMTEYDEDDDDYYSFTYIPDMSERPEALVYLLGERDDFND